jgi:hypothetical protein
MRGEVDSYLGAPHLECGPVLWGSVMQGFITTRDVLLHPRLVVESFGFRVYLRCLYKIARSTSSNRPVTFLECI